MVDDNKLQWLYVAERYDGTGGIAFLVIFKPFQIEPPRLEMATYGPADGLDRGEVGEDVEGGV